MSSTSQEYAVGDLCSLVKGISPTLKTDPGDYPLVVTAAFRRTAADWQIEGPAVCVPLVSSTGHGDAAIHRVHFQDGKFALANLMVALLPKDLKLCDARYLYHFLQARKDEILVPLMLGTANVSLKERDIAAVRIPLPSIDEQRRIVARIEALAEKLANAACLRSTAVDELSALRASYSRRVFEALEADSIPLEEVCSEIIDNLHSTPTYRDGGTVPCIRSPDVGFGTLDLEAARRTDEEEYVRRTVRGAPRENDIVLVREGGGTGKCALVLPDQKFSLGQRVMMLRPDQARVLPRFLLLQMLSPVIQDEHIQPLLKGSASPHLNIGSLRRFPIKLPAIKVQRAVAAGLDALQAKLDSISALQTETKTELDAMLPAVLDKAFKGEL